MRWQTYLLMIIAAPRLAMAELSPKDRAKADRANGDGVGQGIGTSAQIAFTVDWRSKHSTQVRRLRTDREIRVAVTNLAPFCYAYEIRVNQTPHVAQSSLSLRALFMNEVSLPSELTLVNNGAAESESGSKNTPAAAGDQKGGTRSAAEIRRDSVSSALSDALSAIESVVSQAYGLYDTALETARALEKSREMAKTSLSAFVTATCPDGSRGILHATAVNEWAQAKRELQQFAENSALEGLSGKLTEAEKTSDLANKQLNGLLVSLDPDTRYFMESAPARARTKGILAQIKVLTDATTRVKSETVTEFTKDTKATKTHIAQLDKLAKEPTEQDFPVYISDDIERLDVVISAKGRDLPGGITPLPLTETYSAPVKRTARVVSSVGFALSGIDQRSFGRVTLPRFRGDTSLVKDSIYSTYGDRQRSSAVAFAPFVQTHVNLWDVDWTAVYLTGGVGARTVAGDPRPEYLAGISFGFGDRAFLTLASHWGREERLLLGETDEVMARPVPAAIGDDSAIGTKWARAFAVVLSWKL